MSSWLPSVSLEAGLELVCCLATAATALVTYLFSMRF